MFTAHKSANASKQSKGNPQKSAVTILTSGCHFNGKLFCRGSTRIGGKIEGQIVSEGLLIIEEEAIITAEIRADEVIIQGQVKGKLIANTRVELCDSCQFDGDIASPSLIVREGAQFNGHSTMISAKESGKNAPKVLHPAKPFASDKDKMPEISSDLKQDVAKIKVPDVHVRGA